MIVAKYSRTRSSCSRSARVHVHEDDALLLQVLADLVVDDLGLVLRADAREELALRLRDAEPVERALDVVRDVVPGARRALGRADEVVDVVVVDVGEHGRAPRRLRAVEEVLQGLEPELEHPLGLVLHPGDRLDDLAVDALGRLVEVVVLLVEPVALRVIGAKGPQGGLFGGQDLAGLRGRGRGSHGLLDLQLDQVAVDPHREGLDGLVGRKGLRGTGAQVEQRAVARALQRARRASSSTPSASGPSSCEQRSSIANSSPAQLTTAISRSSHSMTRMAPGGSSVTGQMSMISGTEVQIRLSQKGLYRGPRSARVALSMREDTLRITLLGGFSVAIDGAPVDERAWRLRKARSLVKVAALAPGRRVHRDVVAELLWPDRDATAAANNLHQVLHAARRALGRSGRADARRRRPRADPRRVGRRRRLRGRRQRRGRGAGGRRGPQPRARPLPRRAAARGPLRALDRAPPRRAGRDPPGPRGPLRRAPRRRTATRAPRSPRWPAPRPTRRATRRSAAR